jgi:predicted hotdog family 3-hydroxylacyl-ACP dehydratase
MDTLKLSDLTLEDLLPHRGEMLLVKEILEVDNTHALTLCRVETSWPMAEDNGVSPLILVELAAQTAGVCNGWDRIQAQGIDSDKTGWLVGVKKAEFFIDSLSYGDIITSSAENTYNFTNLREVSCEQYLNNVLIGKTTLQLFQA